MRVRLAYGRDGLDVELPDEHVVTELVYQPAPPLEHPAAELRRLLQEPQGTPSLA